MITNERLDDGGPRSCEGVALTLALFVMLMMTLLGYGVLAASRSATRVSNGFQSQKIAFEAAEAGVEYARERVRTRRASGTSYTQLLTTARNGGRLVDASSLASFSGTTGLVNATTNIPFVASTALGGGAFQAFVNNDRAEGVTTATDSNNAIMLTSFGSGPNGVGFAVVQAEVRMGLDLPAIPGVITLPGPSVDFHPFNSETNEHEVDGDDAASSNCYATIGVTSSTALAQVNAAIAAKADHYVTCPSRRGASSTENFVSNNPASPSNPYEPRTPNTPPIVAGDPRLMSVSYLTGLVGKIRDVADFRSPSDPGFTLGSTDSPKIVVIDGDYTVTTAGAGILVVTGALQFNTNISYTGLILAVGKGSVTVVKGGTGSDQYGALLVANTSVPWITDPRYVGIPSYTDGGSGTSNGGNQVYDSRLAQAITVRQSLPLELVSYQQLR